METRTADDSTPEQIILSNAIDFLNAGLLLLFKKSLIGRDAKLAVVSIQTSVELFAKFRLVKDRDISAIVQTGAVPSGSPIEAAMAGRFRTIGFAKCLDEIRKEGEIGDAEEELIGRLQNLRNALVHFSADVDVHDIRTSAAWLLIRVLAMFAAGQDRDVGEMQTHRQFLDPENFAALTQFEPYRSESVDAANDSLDSEDVFRCWECEEDALSLRSSDTYFCYCCGLTADAVVAAYTDCSVCGARQGVCFDALNQTRGHYRGRCLHCHCFLWVWRCKDCDYTRAIEELADPAPCPECAE
jgi:hypothetical protein